MKNNKPISKITKQVLSTITETILSSNLAQNPILKDFAILTQDQSNLLSEKNPIKKPNKSLQNLDKAKGVNMMSRLPDNVELPIENTKEYMALRKNRLSIAKRPITQPLPIQPQNKKGLEL